MKRSLKELIGYTIQATDGEKGKVYDLLFDDESWVTRYLEADLGTLFSQKRVLIPRFYLREPVWEEKHFPIELTMEKIDNSPDMETDLPFSRKYEKELMEHYNIKPYWPVDIAAYAARKSMLNPDTPLKTPETNLDEDKIETHLRSFNELQGYTVDATDDQFGHIDDLIIDDTDWQILYVVVDTKNLLPWSKKVMLPIEVVKKISFLNREATVRLSKETIENAPEYNPAVPVNAEYEKVLYDFYGRKIIK